MAILDVGDGKTYSTITAAVVAARTGTVDDFDIIEIYDNKTYNETIATGSLQWVTFRAATDNNPIINRGNASSIAFNHQNTAGEWTIEGLTLLNFNNGGSDAVFMGANPNGSAVSVRDCVVIGANRFFQQMKGTNIGKPAIIERNFLSGAAAFINLGDKNIFRNNIVKDVTASKQVDMESTTGKAQCSNNLIITNTSASIGIDGYTSDNNKTNLEYINNIIVNYNEEANGTTGIVSNWPYAKNNLIVGEWDNVSSSALSGTLSSSLADVNTLFNDWDAFIAASINSRPTFIAALPSLELASGSIAINAASSGSIFTTADDILKRSRITLDSDSITDEYTLTSSLYFTNGSRASLPFPEHDSATAFSVSCWFQPVSMQNTGVGTLWLFGENNADETSLTLRNADGASTLATRATFVQIFDGDNGVWHSPNNSIESRLSASKWYHIVLTYDKSSIASNPTLYLDNVELTMSESQGPSGTAVSVSYHTGTFGADELGADHADMYFRDWSYWDKELSSTEVSELYNGGHPRTLTNHSAYSDLVAWVIFDELNEGDTTITEDINGTSIILTGSPSLTGSAPPVKTDLGPLRYILGSGAEPLPPRDPRARVSTSKRFRGGVRLVRVYQTIRRE